MITATCVYDVDNWFRLGYGQELQFFSTDDEVQDWITKFFPQEYEPYSLMGYDMVKQGNIYVQVPFELAITELKSGMYGRNLPRFNFWIRSKKITPELNLSKGQRIDRILSYNGLVLLQHGIELHDLGRDASRIAIVDRVRNEVTGEIRKHKEYLNVFNVLKRNIKKTLCYSSIQKNKEGNEYEDTQLQLMTEKAVKSYEEGFLFKNSPGRKLR